MYIIPLPEGVKLGAYQLESVYSLDPYYCIYKAQDRESGEGVLVQEFAPVSMVSREAREFDFAAVPGKEAAFAKMLERFLKFYSTAAELSHASLGKVLGVYRVLGSGIAVHEMPPEGASLPEKMKDLAGMSSDRLEKKMMLLLDAVSYMHERNVLHGNISLNSIFWDEARQNMVIQGMFCLLERERDVQTTVVHDVNVAAPETLLKGGAYDSRAEVYSLASCFYFLITGEPLIRGDQRFCSAHQTGLASDRHLQSRYSSGFLKSLDRALQVRREDRFASASVWINELKKRA